MQSEWTLMLNTVSVYHFSARPICNLQIDGSLNFHDSPLAFPSIGCILYLLELTATLDPLVVERF